MKLYVIRAVLGVWAVATFYVMLTLWSRANIDEVGDFLHPHAPHSLDAAGDPVLNRKQVVGMFRDKLLGGSRVQTGSDGTARPLQTPVTVGGSSGGSGPQGGPGVATEKSETVWTKHLKYKNTCENDRTWPYANGERHDRILNQLNIKPPDVPGSKLKKILLWAGLGDRNAGQSHFTEQHRCPVSSCTLSGNQKDADHADLILFEQSITRPVARRPSRQIWVLFLLEPPYATPGLSDYNGQVNWTATYRLDSTLVAPYEIYLPFANFTGQLPDKPPRDYAAGKSKMVAWFVSNCGAPSGRRTYVEELSKYIDVHIYGPCGTRQCPRTNHRACEEMLQKEYFFYLSFESQTCKDYITEKYFRNALMNDVVPVVMGAPREDYERRSPPQSFIHVDDFASPRDLAAHLKEVAADPTRYNNYFRWKGTGETDIDTKFWCRLCAMLHESHRTGHHSVYDRLEDWWRGPGICVQPKGNEPQWGSWRTANASLPVGEFYREWTER